MVLMDLQVEVVVQLALFSQRYRSQHLKIPYHLRRQAKGRPRRDQHLDEPNSVALRRSTDLHLPRHLLLQHRLLSHQM